MNITQPTLRLYALALRLYPAAFRARYADEMLDTTQHEYALSPNRLRFTASLAADTLRSLLREHLRTASRARPGYVATFALFFSVLLLTVAVVSHQVLRRSADHFPTVVAKIVSDPAGNATGEALRTHIVSKMMNSPDKIEISSPRFLNKPLAFAIFYDASAHAIGGNAVLHGAFPQPPIGIFNEIRARDNDEVTWQPQPGIRLALSGRPMPNGGFVVSGQSLIPTESREIRLHAILLWIWAVAMLVCCLIAFTARKPTVAANT